MIAWGKVQSLEHQEDMIARGKVVSLEDLEIDLICQTAAVKSWDYLAPDCFGKVGTCQVSPFPRRTAFVL